MDLGIGGRVAVVTGGSRGIGKAIAMGLAREGARVAICARNLDGAEEAAEEIAKETGAEALAVQADVTSSSDVERFVSSVMERFGRIDILVNNAANFRSAPFFDLTDDDWLDHFNVKMVGYVRMIRSIAPHMKQAHWGRIINIAGGAAREGGAYGWKAGPINAGIVNLTKKLCDELGPSGITVNAIHPGGGRTDRREASYRRTMEAEGISREEVERRAVADVPIGRLVGPEDTANTIVFLASEAAGAITGQILSVDGGKTRGVFY